MLGSRIRKGKKAFKKWKYYSQIPVSLEIWKKIIFYELILSLPCDKWKL